MGIDCHGACAAPVDLWWMHMVMHRYIMVEMEERLCVDCGKNYPQITSPYLVTWHIPTK